jgi:hypothetical protein
MKNLSPSFLFLILLGAWRAFAQLPTAGLQIQYDMLTITGGTTLSDLSGNGNNGTLSGTTQNAYGTTFNGSSDYITVPKVISNSDFTVMVVAQQKASGNTGTVWSETVSGNENQLLRLGIDAGSWMNVTGTGGSGTLNGLVSLTDRNPDWDVYFFSRSTTGLTGGRLSRQNGTGRNVLSGATTVTTTNASIGVEDLVGSKSNYFNGSVAYFALWNRQLSQTELQTAYAAMASAVVSRPVFVAPWPAYTYTGPVWQRQGVVIRSVGGGNPGEPMVLYEGSCQVVTGTNCFKAWISYNNATYYEESLDGLVWSVGNGGSSVIPGGRPGVVHNGSTYYAYVENASTPTAFNQYTSSNGMTGWTLAHSSVISLGSTGTWDASIIYNPFVTIVGGTWYMVWEGNGVGTPDSIGGATSSDGVTWTQNTANPITGRPDTNGTIGNAYSCQGPFIANVNSAWWLWCGEVGNTIDLGRFTSPTFNGLFAWNPYKPTLVGTAGSEATNTSDPCLVEANGKTYMFYASQQVGGAYAGIKLAIANMTMSQLVRTSEGQMTDWP